MKIGRWRTWTTPPGVPGAPAPIDVVLARPDGHHARLHCLRRTSSASACRRRSAGSRSSSAARRRPSVSGECNSATTICQRAEVGAARSFALVSSAAGALHSSVGVATMHRCPEIEAERFSRPATAENGAKLVLMRFSGRFERHLSASIFESEDCPLPRFSSRRIVPPPRFSKRSASIFEASIHFPDGVQPGGHRVARPARGQSR